MKKIVQKVIDFIKEEDGAIAVEYILLIVFVALLILAGATFFSTSVSNKYSEIGSKVQALNTSQIGS